MTARRPFDHLQAALSTAPEGRLGLAVSGGGDSMALLALTAEWAQGQGRQIQVATVNHGLRPEAAQEAKLVARCCALLGLPHQTLRWQGWDGAGNLQDQARQARYRLLADWADQAGLAAILVGHTLEDQAETLLMRLRRGAGVDGLSGIAARRRIHGVLFLRPLLQASRGALRQELKQRDLPWAEDPSNEDPQFDRVQLRQALAQGGFPGLGPDALQQVSDNMAQAQAALNWAAARFAQENITQIQGDLIFDHAAWCDLPAELQRRCLVAAIRWIAGGAYPPRRAEIARLIADLTRSQGPQRRTLAGVCIARRRGGLHLFREFQQVATAICPADRRWDQRWHLVRCEDHPATDQHRPDLHSPDLQGLELRALGKSGLAQLPNWRDSGRPAAAVQADPGLWRENRLLLSPLAGDLQGWRLGLAPEREDFTASFQTH